MSKGQSHTIQLNNTESALLKALLEHGTYMTTTQIAKECDMSWNTVIKYLQKLKNRNWIMHEKHGNRDLWKAERA